MSATVVFFPVGNGDMTLIETDSGKKILIDCRIREGSEHPDVITDLRKRLTRDSKDRLFIDVFIWSHPDEDHCLGISKYFHLGKPEDWNEDNDLIFINGIWSSPLVFRRASKNHTLTGDAKELNKEAKRRVNKFREVKSMTDGNYVKILAEDENGKTDDILDIVLKIDNYTTEINSFYDSSFKANLLGPSPKSDIDEDEENLGKNHSSVIINFTLSAGTNSASYLTGGDAEVVCWETLLKRMKTNNSVKDLNYDIMLAPHHCSWHTLSHESWSGFKAKGQTAKASDDALEALGQANESAIIISSSKSIEDDDTDPPSFAAKNEYLKILDNVSGTFKCVADNIDKDINMPLEIEISSENGINIRSASKISSASVGTPVAAVNRKGGNGYA